MMSFSYY